MIFEITITSEDGEVIEIGKDEKEQNFITDVVIHMDTVNNDVRNKAPAMLAKIEIHGAINSEVGDRVLKLFEWSKELNEKKWYRTITIKAKTSIDKPYRTYIFEKVFVVDYWERYKTESAQGDEQAKNADRDHFELFLTQKENNFKTIEAY